MNFINLLSISESKNNLSDELFKKYLDFIKEKLNEINNKIKVSYKPKISA